MNSATLDDLMAFNDQLAALAEAGLPLDAGLAAGSTRVRDSLERINAVVARNMSRGETLDEALRLEDPSLPPRYQSLVQTGLRGGDISAPLRSTEQLAESVDETRHVVRSAFVYPLILCGLAYLGVIGLCLFVLPTIERMYETLQLQPGPAVGVLQLLRETMPVWIAVLPLVLLILAAWRLLGGTNNGATAGGAGSEHFSATSRSIFDERCAMFAAALARLLEQQVPFDEALRLAGSGCGDANLAAGAQALADGLNMGQSVDENSAAALRFPPFQRWVLWHSDASIGQAPALEAAAVIYRKSARRHAARARILAPALATAVIGGGAVLLYGLALFAPMVELLRSIALPN
jgi:type II secretory pathway component PulF